MEANKRRWVILAIFVVSGSADRWIFEWGLKYKCWFDCYINWWFELSKTTPCTRLSGREPTEKSTEPWIKLITNNTLLRWSKWRSSKPTKNYKNVPFMKSISSPTSKRTNISSPTMICSKLKITSILSTNTAMVEHLKAYFENNILSKKKKPFLSSNNSLKHFKSSTSTTSCTEISNLIIYSFIVEYSKLEILDSVKAWKRPRWPKLC